MVFILSFFRYGFKVGQYPWYFTLGCLVFSALCGVGLINYTEEKNAFRFNFSIKWTGSLDSDLSPDSDLTPESDCESRVKLRQESLLFYLLAKLSKLQRWKSLFTNRWKNMRWDRFIVSWIKSNFFCWFTGFEQIVHVKLILFWFAVIAE